jgi:hypothetical protein
MSNIEIPIVVIKDSLGLGVAGNGMMMVKGLVSSMTRSTFSGRLLVLRNSEMPIYRVGRKAVDELFVSAAMSESFDLTVRKTRKQISNCMSELVKPAARQWVVMADGASLALRNIDHLIPPDSFGAFGLSGVDFYWARAGNDHISNQSATPGLWAVRGEYLPLVLELLNEEWSKESGAERGDEEAIWTRVVQELPLRKRAFEKGEVVAPRIGAVDWEAVSNAAFVTVPDWPEKEAWKFLQALYFGTYLGDETGMMLNILEA